jgi:hypothetical protein
MSMLSKALKKAGGAVQDAWEDVTGGAEDIAQDAADEAKRLGKRLVTDWRRAGTSWRIFSIPR